FLQTLFESLPAIVGRPHEDPFAALDALEPVAALRAARRYLEPTGALAPASAARIVDKMPDNIHYLGLIPLLLPAARVIICARDPRDVAISCWQTGFATISWANDPDHIARRFAEYQRLLAHWRSTRLLEWLEVRYEDLVRDLEGHARRLVEFVQLDWDPD